MIRQNICVVGFADHNKLEYLSTIKSILVQMQLGRMQSDLIVFESELNRNQYQNRNKIDSTRIPCKPKSFK